MSKMIDALPIFMRKSKVFNEIFNAEEKQFGKLNIDVNDLRLQMDINTATWGLDVYERELKIPIDTNKPIDERRSVIKSKLRGSGKADAALIKMVADSFTNGGVDVLFDGQIGIIFNDTLGIPPNLQDLEHALDDIKPAHLNIYYEFMYRTYTELLGMYGTYDDLANSGLTYGDLMTT